MGEDGKISDLKEENQQVYCHQYVGGQTEGQEA